MPARLKKSGEWKFHLAGVDEFAETLAVSKSAIVRWAEEGLLPEPVDYLALGRVWQMLIVLDIYDVVSVVGRPPSDGSRDRSRARRYAKVLREIRALAEEEPIAVNFGDDDPVERRATGVRLRQRELIEQIASSRRQRANQNGNPSTGTNSFSETR